MPANGQRRRGAAETCCKAIVDKVIRDRGIPHAVQVLRTIIESEGNADQLTRPMILAVSDVILAHPRWAESGLALLEVQRRLCAHFVDRTLTKATAHTRAALSTATSGSGVKVAAEPSFRAPLLADTRCLRLTIDGRWEADGGVAKP